MAPIEAAPTPTMLVNLGDQPPLPLLLCRLLVLPPLLLPLCRVLLRRLPLLPPRCRVPPGLVGSSSS